MKQLAEPVYALAEIGASIITGKNEGTAPGSGSSGSNNSNTPGNNNNNNALALSPHSFIHSLFSLLIAFSTLML